MRIAREDESLLEHWICASLEKLHERNPETLSKYIISLLNQDLEAETLQQHCREELKTFLKGNAERFVQELFAAVQSGVFRDETQVDYEEDNEEEEDLDQSRDEDDERDRRRYRDRRDSDARENAQSFSTDRSEHNNHRDEHASQSSGRESISANNSSSYNTSRDHQGNRGRDRNDRNPRDQRDYRDNRRNEDRFTGKRTYDADWGRQAHDRMPPNQSAMPYYPMDPQHWGMPPPPMFIPSYMTGAPYWAGYGPQSNAYATPPVPYPHHPLGPPPIPPSIPTGYGYYPPAGADMPPMPSSGPLQAEGPSKEDVSFDGSSVPRPQAAAPPSNDLSDGGHSPSEAAEAQHHPDEDPIVEAAASASPSKVAQAPRSQAPAAGADAGYSYPSYGMPYSPPYGARGANAGGSGAGGNGGSHRRAGNERRGQSVHLPESERCTLKCTGIPSYVKEEDLRTHFEAFGSIVELQVSPMASDARHAEDKDDKDKKKVYNECLVQFHSAANAKRCLSSPAPVLNNRFIHIYQSHFNIIPPSDVSPPPVEMQERDQELLAQEHINPSVPVITKPKPAPGMVFQPGVSNKWRRTDAGKVPGSGAKTEPATSSGEAPVAVVAAPAEKKEDLEVKQTFSQLKTLAQQNSEILKKKEAIIMTQMEEYRKMVDKLEMQEDSDNKANLLQKLESKIVDLQGQLRTVRDEINGVVTSDKQSPPPKYMGRGRGFPAGRGFHGGFPAARGFGRGRGFPGRGRGPNLTSAATAPSRAANPFSAAPAAAAAADSEESQGFLVANLDEQLAAVGEQLYSMEDDGGEVDVTTGDQS